MARRQRIPNPDLALIRAQNARSIARRASVSALAQSVARTDFASLTRAPKRQIGGRFERILPEPKPTRAPRATVPDDLINRFFAALRFQASQQVVPRQTVVQGPSPDREPFGRAASIFASRNPFIRTNVTGKVGRF